jgi:hypothetical protein
LELPGVDFAAAKEMARSALSAVREGSLGYAIIHAWKTSTILKGSRNWPELAFYRDHNPAKSR